jgi:hypothetical protein
MVRLSTGLWVFLLSVNTAGIRIAGPLTATARRSPGQVFLRNSSRREMMKVSGIRVTGRFVIQQQVSEPVIVPANAILDENDDPILDENNNYILDHFEP